MDEVTKHPLRALREARGLSMQEFAEILGIPKPTLQRRENGSLPDVREGQRMARILDVEVSSLWPELPESEVTPDGPQTGTEG